VRPSSAPSSHRCVCVCVSHIHTVYVCHICSLFVCLGHFHARTLNQQYRHV
jgi:hypothetical protein